MANRNRAYVYFTDFFKLWDCLILASMIAVVIFIPLGMAFPAQLLTELRILDGLATVMIAAELMGNREISRRERSRLQMVSWISILPISEFLLATAPMPAPVHYLALAFHLLRVPGLLRRYRERRHNLLISHKLLASGILSSIFVIIHIFGCVWLVINPDWERADAMVAYNKALYYVVTTLTTVGYGDITPTTNGGRIFAMANMLLGVGVFGLVIGQVSQFIIESDKRKESMKQKLEAMTALFDYYDIPPNLQNEVFKFYQHVLSKRVSEDEQKVLAELPAALQAELAIFMNMKPISQVSLFEGVSQTCLKSVAKKMEQVFFAPGEPVIKKGELGAEMYIILHGSVKVHVGDHFITSLHAGQCFGEMALIQDEKRMADVTAESHCDLITLSKDRFLELIKEYPELNQNVKKLIEKRQQAEKAA